MKLQVRKTTTYRKVKVMMSKRNGVPTKDIQLLYEGKHLEDHEKVQNRTRIVRWFTLRGC
jgi:hypothetical protein